jgi:hypothetical protein
MSSILPKIGLAILLTYCPIADLATPLIIDELDKRILSTAIKVRGSYTSGNHQAAADYGREAIRLKDIKETVEFVQSFLPGRMIKEAQRERRAYLRSLGYDYPE